MIEQESIDEFQKVLKSLGVGAEIVGCKIKEPMRRFSLRLDPKTRPSKLEGLSQDMALQMRSASPPLIRSDYQDGIILVEFMYGDHPTVNFTEIMESVKLTSDETLAQNELPVIFGTVDVDKPLVVDLTKLPHLLVAGATGSGKSIFLHSVINSLLANADKINLKLALIDPKFVEFTRYNKLPQLLYPVVNDLEFSIQMLDQLFEEVDRRLRVFKKHGCRDAEEYRKKIKKIPYIILVIDELADLIKSDKKAVEHKLCILLQKCRAAGIFVIAATQHPSSKVITGDIKANFPAKVAFKVSTHSHSRVVLDRNGAERLLGRGDGLFLDESGLMKRFKGAISPAIKSEKVLNKKAAGKAKPKATGKGSLLANIIEALNLKKGRK